MPLPKTASRSGSATALACGVAAGFAFVPPSAIGEGFRNPPPGGFSLARAGGRIAQVDTPEAAYHNPANVVDLPSAGLEASATIVYLKVDNNNAASGLKAETRDPWKLLPNFFATTPLIEKDGGSKLSAGLAVTTPFGLSNEWKKEGAFGPGGAVLPSGGLGLRYGAPWYTELLTINANPSLSYKITDNLFIGVGVDFFWSQLTIKQLYPWFAAGIAAGVPAPVALTFPDGDFRGKGDGEGIGGNIGLTWKITDSQRVALAYRSPFDINYNGDLDVNNIPTGFPATSTSHFGTKVKYPGIFSAGYGIEINDKLRLETDFEWIQFSRFDRLVIDAGNNGPLFAGGGLDINQNWRDTFTAGIGADYRCGEHWTLRGGYQFYETPVPDSTFSTTIPDANQHAVTVGLNFKSGHHSADLSYGWIHYDDRNITSDQNPVFNGKYQMVVHLISVGYNYNF